MRRAIAKLPTQLSQALFSPARIAYLAAPGTSRSISTHRIEMPEDISEAFFSRVQRSLDSMPIDAQLKPLTHKEGEAATKELERLIASNPELVESFAEAKKATVAIIDGVSVPDIKGSEVPKYNAELYEQSFVRRIRSGEIALYAYGKILGTTPELYTGNTLITAVFANEPHREDLVAYDSGRSLEFHNDGWYGETIPNLLLLGIVGKEGVKTEVVDYEDIVAHFRESGKEKLLETLNRWNWANPIGEDSIGNHIKIIDLEEKKLNYAQYGSFRFSPELKEALSFLNDTLEVIPRVSVEVQKGELLAIKNDRALHRRRVEAATPETSPEMPKTFTHRLLLRSLGDEQKR